MPVLTALLKAIPPAAAAIASFYKTWHELDDLSREVVRQADMAELTERREFYVSYEYTKQAAEELCMASPQDLFSHLRALLLQSHNVPQGSVIGHPDVLQVLCKLLTPPEFSHFRNVVRSAIVLGLRQQYKIDFNAPTLRDLRAHRDHLDVRVAGQKKAGVLKSITPGASIEHFITDVLAMDGAISRTFSTATLGHFLDGFAQAPLGIDPTTSVRHYGKNEETPQLSGRVPDFPTLVNSVFGQPLGVKGLDTVLGGVLPVLLSDNGTPEDYDVGGGQVTLIAGPPGSGKTTLALLIAKNLAELGSAVRYATSEEDKAAIQMKLVTSGAESILRDALIGHIRPANECDFKILTREKIRDLSTFSIELEHDLKQLKAQREVGRAASSVPFPFVVVVDSITALAHKNKNRRQELNLALQRFRSIGACIFLVGSKHDPEDAGLAYLVDNVIRLDVEHRGRWHEHPLRILSIDKTRAQTSFRGRHVMHLSRRTGCAVSPSLHSAIRQARSQGSIPQGDQTRPVTSTTPNAQLSLFDEVRLGPRARVLVYGRGSAGKAQFALRLTQCRQRPRGTHGDEGEKVLIVSFLYDKHYYDKWANELAKKLGPQSPLAIEVLSFYPGYIDPETVVSRIRDELEDHLNLGVPYSAVILDGLHNTLMQYPLLAEEPLFWPALTDLLSTFSVLVISTTSSMGRYHLDEPAKGTGAESRPIAVVTEDPIASTHSIFFHLLISACDESFVVEEPRGAQRQGYWVYHSSSQDHEATKRPYKWNPATFDCDIVTDKRAT